MSGTTLESQSGPHYPSLLGDRADARRALEAQLTIQRLADTRTVFEAVVNYAVAQQDHDLLHFGTDLLALVGTDSSPLRLFEEHPQQAAQLHELFAEKFGGTLRGLQPLAPNEPILLEQRAQDNIAQVEPATWEARKSFLSEHFPPVVAFLSNDSLTEQHRGKPWYRPALGALLIENEEGTPKTSLADKQRWVKRQLKIFLTQDATKGRSVKTRRSIAQGRPLVVQEHDLIEFLWKLHAEGKNTDYRFVLRKTLTPEETDLLKKNS